MSPVATPNATSKSSSVAASSSSANANMITSSPPSSASLQPASSNGSGNDQIPADLNPDSLGFMEELWEAYHLDPSSVPAEWKSYFDTFGENGDTQVKLKPSFPRRTIFRSSGSGAAATSANFGAGASRDAAVRQERVDQLIRNYRLRGHIAAQIDPLGQTRVEPAELSPEFYGFTEADYDLPFSTIRSAGPNVRTLRQIIDWLRNTYCRSIGVQFMHIDSLTVREWLQNEMEATENRLRLARHEQVRILKRLTDATVFEQVVAKKFLGKKAFSLQGAESLIPLLDLAIEKAGNDGVNEVVLGMAHRGRLNVLTNIAGKKARDIFREFMDKDPEQNMGRGDVKYHLGYDTQWVTSTEKQVHISLCFNPSHLEFVNPVAMGRMKAKLDRLAAGDPSKGLVIQIHGDAAFAGEGIIQETLNLSELGGYNIGGSLHIIVNNQVGFTTDPSDARSCTYCTDVAKMLQIPIFHVNGEDPEAVAQTVQLALDFRKKYQRDVVIDMYCYRLRGHNEGDEPEFTQPLMYRKIKAKKTVRESYVDHLLQMGGLSKGEADRMLEYQEAHLNAEYDAASEITYQPTPEMLQGIWAGYTGGAETQANDPDTGVPVDQQRAILNKLVTLPAGFTPHPNISKFVLSARKEMAEGKRLLDWGAAESLAFGSLLLQGHPIRMTGQDVGRGTFSHRHAALTDYQTGKRYIGLQFLDPEQAKLSLYNSPLSEAGVLGYEYGYSLDCPTGLTLWEAQFGDFVNAAQVIIDQFIVSAEEKWRRLGAVVMLLPHGFEGSGPEHSSARLERFLELCASDNIQVAVPSTPAQYFHLLRRQVIRKWRKPLIVMTPKSLLRNQLSSLEECSQGTFQRVIGDTVVDAKQVERIVACSGKIYFELVKKREELKRNDVAIVRLEQLYPLPTEALKSALAGYRDGIPFLWVQEEPENMGACRFLRAHYGTSILNRFPLSWVARRAAGSPATGSTKSHEMEQEQILNLAFAQKK